jgi:hypothetical protein
MYKFYSTLTFDESIDHRQQNFDPAKIETYRRWYTEDIQDRDTLLITVGDSWTWGDHLGNIDWNKASDDPCRLQQIYGRLLADKLESDWVNLARPGCSNYWMLEKLQDIQTFIKNAQYKKIYLVITLTEDLREAKYTRRIQVLPTYQQFWENSSSIKDFLQQVENYLFDNLQQYFDSVNVVSVVSRAFTDSWQQRSWMLDKTWCDVIQDNFNFDNYQRPVPFIAQMSINPLTEKFISQHPERKVEFLDIMEAVGNRWQFLGVSPYNLKGSTYHPNPAGHKLWAEYLFSQIP